MNAFKGYPGFTMPRQGDVVTVTVIPECVTGPWQFTIIPYATDSPSDLPD